MSVRRGPTERDRSEGTLRNEGPNQEQAPLVTWGAFPSNSPKAKPEAVRPTLLILDALDLTSSTHKRRSLILMQMALPPPGIRQHPLQ
jgi:hypothetical protein